MKINKLISTILGIVMIWCIMIPFRSNAIITNRNTLTDGIYTYKLVNGAYTITKCNITAIVSEVPKIRNGYPITAIGDKAFMNCINISEMNIPDTVKTIGSGAFAGCSSLNIVTLPKKLDKIKANLFMGCTELEKIDIPDSVKTIESYAFFNCSKLSSLVLPASLDVIQSMAFSECSSIDKIDASKCSTYVFQDGILYNKDKNIIVRASTMLTGDVYIPDGISVIDAGAFSVCAKIEHLFLPNSITEIGEDAFGYCVSLKNIDFSEGLKSIRPVAFKYCCTLQTLEFPKTLIELGEGAFYNCKKLSRVIFNDNIMTVGDGLFANCTDLTEVTVPSSMTEIGKNSFGFDVDNDGNYSLKEGFLIKGYSGSAAEKYAKSNNIAFITVGNSNKKMFLIISMILITKIILAVALLKMNCKL